MILYQEIEPRKNILDLGFYFTAFWGFIRRQTFRIVAVSALILGIFVFSRKSLVFLTVNKPYVSFSHSGGIYDDPFNLVLGTHKAGVQIRYTLDGSLPTETSLLYGGPLVIARPRVVRAQVFQGESGLGEVYTNTYIVGRSLDLPVISISTDPKNLWDSEIGIYAEGSEDVKNFDQRGFDWERPVFLEYYEPDGTLGFSQDLGLRIHGGATRRNAQKGLRIIARRMYGQNQIIYPIFEDAPYYRFRRLLLRGSGNDWWSTMMRDAMMQTLVRDLKLDTQRYKPAVVYLNGDYRGIHNIREYFDERYFKSNYGVKDDTVVILHPDRENSGYPEIIEGTPGDEAHYVSLVDFVTSNDMSVPENYEYVQTLMDVENYIDYYASQLYFGNFDWPHHNLRVWRFKSDFYNPTARYGLDGRWRWLMYDVDEGFRSVEADLLDYVTAPDVKGHVFANALIRGLLENPDFKRDLINRHADLLNSIFLPEVVIPQIDSIQAAISSEIPFHIEKWGGRLDKGARPAFETVERWEKNVGDLRNFALDRPDFSRQHFVNKFDLSGVSTVLIATSLSGGGTVRINTLDITEFPREVVYFQDVSLPLEAVPSFGYRFVGWETTGSLRDSSSARINTVVLDDPEEVILAKFEPTLVGKILGLGKTFGKE